MEDFAVTRLLRQSGEKWTTDLWQLAPKTRLRVLAAHSMVVRSLADRSRHNVVKSAGSRELVFTSIDVLYCRDCSFETGDF
jgi:hypothetical protein